MALIDYDKMLDRLYASLPAQALQKERFEMPVVESFPQGPKTFIKNFSSIVKTIRREEKDVIKFLNKELAAPANVEEGRLALTGKFSQKQLQELMVRFITEYVLCHECKKPDTNFTERNGVKVLKCEACGALSPVKRIG